MPIKSYINILLFVLLIAMFFERYFFVKVVYKTRNYGFSLIILIIFLNTIFLFVIQRLRIKKHKKRLHELYNIDRASEVGLCVVALIGAIDTLKAFLVFWPANVMPLWLLVSLL